MPESVKKYKLDRSAFQAKNGSEPEITVKITRN